MKISEIIAKGTSYTSDEVELLKVEVELFLKKMAASQAEILAERSNFFVSPATLEIFFRSKERNEKTGQILQYLLAFLVHIPGTAENESKAFNPIEQFQECVRFLVDLLLEEGVSKAVFNEINQMGSLNGDNVWDFQRRIIEKNRELNELLATGTCKEASTFFTLCLVLENLCLFWFDVKGEDIQRIRRSDIYIYKLTRILQDRYRQIPES
jgi:hypothetical protein